MDRHGILAERIVGTTVGSETVPSVFVGTPSAFGVFSPETRLITSDGGTARCGDLVENGGVTDKSFETHVGLPEPRPGPGAAAVFWAALETASSAFAGDARIVLRCRDATVATTAGCEFPEGRRYGSHRYCVVDQTVLCSELDRDWAGAVLALGRRWLCFAGERRRLECERRAFSCGLWMLSALGATGVDYRITYDSIQHTAYMFIEEGARATGPVVRGACAFQAPSSAEVVQLTWEDGSWNPIIAGFIVAAARRTEGRP